MKYTTLLIESLYLTTQECADLKGLSLFLDLNPDSAYDILGCCIIEDKLGVNAVPCMRSLLRELVWKRDADVYSHFLQGFLQLVCRDGNLHDCESQCTHQEIMHGNRTRFSSSFLAFCMNLLSLAVFFS